MRLKMAVASATGALVIFVLGLFAGMWFSQHYRIVPVNEPLSHPQEPFRSAAAPAQQEKTLPAPFASPVVEPQPAVPSRPAPAPSSGLFTYQFVPGETLHYRLDADVQGTGFELGEGSNIGLNLQSAMALTTESVDSAGAGQLRLDFGTLDMTGDFMGSPVVLHRDPDSTKLEMDSRTRIDSKRGIDQGLIPQLEFLGHPVRMTIARNGDVVNVGGAAGFDRMLAPMMKLSPPESNGDALQPNAQWISQFQMPVPGLVNGVASVARNTFTGYATMNGRQCAVITQELSANQTQGTLSAGTGSDAMRFLMPSLTLTGNNTIYFDVANGKLVRCDMDLDFGLDIGAPLKSLAELMQTYGNGPGDNSGKANVSPEPPDSGNNENMGVKIKASFNLEE